MKKNKKLEFPIDMQNQSRFERGLLDVERRFYEQFGSLNKALLKNIAQRLTTEAKRKDPKAKKIKAKDVEKRLIEATTVLDEIKMPVGSVLIRQFKGEEKELKEELNDPKNYRQDFFLTESYLNHHTERALRESPKFKRQYLKMLKAELDLREKEVPADLRNPLIGKIQYLKKHFDEIITKNIEKVWDLDLYLKWIDWDSLNLKSAESPSLASSNLKSNFQLATAAGLAIVITGCAVGGGLIDKDDPYSDGDLTDQIAADVDGRLIDQALADPTGTDLESQEQTLTPEKIEKRRDEIIAYWVNNYRPDIKDNLEKLQKQSDKYFYVAMQGLLVDENFQNVGEVIRKGLDLFKDQGRAERYMESLIIYNSYEPDKFLKLILPIRDRFSNFWEVFHSHFSYKKGEAVLDDLEIYKNEGLFDNQEEKVHPLEIINQKTETFYLFITTPEKYHLLEEEQMQKAIQESVKRLPSTFLKFKALGHFDSYFEQENLDRLAVEANLELEKIDKKYSEDSSLGFGDFIEDLPKFCDSSKIVNNIFYALTYSIEKPKSTTILGDIYEEKNLRYIYKEYFYDLLNKLIKYSPIDFFTHYYYQIKPFFQKNNISIQDFQASILDNIDKFEPWKCHKEIWASFEYNKNLDDICKWIAINTPDLFFESFDYFGFYLKNDKFQENLRIAAQKDPIAVLKYLVNSEYKTHPIVRETIDCAKSEIGSLEKDNQFNFSLTSQLLDRNNFEMLSDPKNLVTSLYWLNHNTRLKTRNYNKNFPGQDYLVISIEVFKEIFQRDYFKEEVKKIGRFLSYGELISMIESAYLNMQQETGKEDVDSLEVYFKEQFEIHNNEQLMNMEIIGPKTKLIIFTSDDPRHLQNSFDEDFVTSGGKQENIIADLRGPYDQNGRDNLQFFKELAFRLKNLVAEDEKLLIYFNQHGSGKTMAVSEDKNINITPEILSQFLEDSGIADRVIIIGSSCYNADFNFQLKTSPLIGISFSNIGQVSYDVDLSKLKNLKDVYKIESDNAGRMNFSIQYCPREEGKADRCLIIGKQGPDLQEKDKGKGDEVAVV
jgi:hypothetical protein